MTRTDSLLGDGSSRVLQGLHALFLSPTYELCGSVSFLITAHVGSKRNFNNDKICTYDT